MPFINNPATAGKVASRTYIAPRGPVQTQGDSSFSQGGNYGNTGINQALTSGPVASRIAQLDAANPGMNMRQRLTAGARDAITGILGDAKTGGRFDINIPYYRDAVMQRLEQDASAAAQMAKVAQEHRAQQAGAAGVAGGGMAPQRSLVASPTDSPLPSSMNRGSINGVPQMVPTAGNYKNGQFDSDLALLRQTGGLAAGDISARGVMEAIARRGQLVEQDKQNKLNQARQFEMGKVVVPAQIKANSDAAKKANTDAAKAAGVEAKRVTSQQKSRVTAGNKVQSILGKMKEDVGKKSGWRDYKNNGAYVPANFSDANQGLTNEGYPALPPEWSRPIPGDAADPVGHGATPNAPDAAHMLGNEAWYKHAITQIRNTATSPEEAAFMVQQLSETMRQGGVRPFWNTQAGTSAPMSNGAATPPSQPAPQAPSASPPAMQQPQAAPARPPQQPMQQMGQAAPAMQTTAPNIPKDEASFVSENLGKGAAYIRQMAMKAGYPESEVNAITNYAKALGAR